MFTKSFEKIVSEIFELIGSYGIRNKPIDVRNIQNISESDKKEFLASVHTGYRLGQQRIVEEIIPILMRKALLNGLLVEANKTKNKLQKSAIKQESSEIEFKVAVLRHFADLIAWVVFRNDMHKARRFHSGSRSRPDLLHSNLDSILAAVDTFHKEDPSSFALISDLTTFIDIGDIMLLKEGKIFIVECKEGMVQKNVFEFIDLASKDDFAPEKLDFTKMNAKFFNQVERTLKQMERASEAVNFLNIEKGRDPFTKENIVLFEDKRPRIYYFEELKYMINNAGLNGVHYGIIEDTIFVAVYTGRKTIFADLFPRLIEQRKGNFINVNYASLIYLPLKEPFLFKPFGEEIILSLIFGRIQVRLGLDLDRFIEMFQELGMSARWMTTKETHKYLTSESSHKPFVFKHRAIRVETNGVELVLGDAFIVHLLYDNITPISLVNRYLSYRKTSVE